MCVCWGGGGIGVSESFVFIANQPLSSYRGKEDATGCWCIILSFAQFLCVLLPLWSYGHLKRGRLVNSGFPLLSL